jgi:hypothetical protein
MSRKLEIVWKILAIAVLVGQISKIFGTFSAKTPLSTAEWFDWIMSFPECLVVCLFAAKLAVGSPFLWRTYSFIYPFYALFVIYVCAKLFVERDVPNGHFIAYGLALGIIILIKVLSFHAVWQYGRDKMTWRFAPA